MMPPACRLLVAESDPVLRRELTALLGVALDFSVMACDSLPEAIANGLACDVAVLDWALVDGNLGQLRRLMQTAEGPSLLVIGATESQVHAALPDFPALEILGLDRPFRFGSLVVHLKEQLRRRWEAVGPRLGRFRFDPKAKLLLLGPPSDPVRLTEKEAAILDYLYRQDGAEVGRDALFRALWKLEPGVTTHTLETHIYRLRQKLEVDPSNASVLLTVNGGYRLVISPPDPGTGGLPRETDLDA